MDEQSTGSEDTIPFEPKAVRNARLINAVKISNDPSVVVEALRLKGDVNAVDWEGWSSLHIAVARGSASIVQLLVDEGANVNSVNHSGTTSRVL